MTDKLLSVSQLAERWGWSVAQISRLVRQSKIPHYRLGRRNHDIQFRESEVERWLADRRVAPTSETAAAAARVVDRAAECERLGIPTDHQFS